MSLTRVLETEWPLIALLAVMPFLLPPAVAMQVASLIVFCILALGLNVVVGYTGLLNLGIAAFFGIGAYTTGILVSPSMPFGWNYFAAFFFSGLFAALAGVALAAPTLQLRGDYLALVTLGFGEVVKFSLRNLVNITDGTKTVSPIESPFAALPTFVLPLGSLIWVIDGRTYLYFFCLFVLAVVVLVLRNLERSRLGRAWVAIREDELAASCMGIDVPRVKLAAFATGALLAGIAGSLYAVLQNNTAQPESYDFARSITMLSCVILGGLGSMRGAILGVLLLVGFDLILAPYVDEQLQQSGLAAIPWWGELLKLSNWRYMIFGLSLVLMMRLRPEGLLPSQRVALEFHEHDASAPPAAAGQEGK